MAAQPTLASGMDTARALEEGAAPNGQPERPERKSGRRGCLAKFFKLDMMVVASVVGLAGLAVALAAGALLQAGGFVVGSGRNSPSLTPCLLEQLGYNPAIATEMWNLASPQWVFGVFLVATLLLRHYLFSALARHFYGYLSASKQVKVANYMLELVGTSAALVVCIWAGFFQRLVSPQDFTVPSADQADRLAVGAQVSVILFLTTYTTELYLDSDIRFGLCVHHWTAIVLSLWGLLAIGLMHGNVMMMRCFFAISLYMSTEQNVFVEMLMYQRRFYLPKLFYASAWYYLLTRLAIMVCSLKVWWQAREDVFEKGLHDSWVVYSLWLFVPMANVVLNASQLTTVQSLLGIAASVKARCAERAREEELSEEIEEIETNIAAPSPVQGQASAERTSRRRKSRVARAGLLALQGRRQLLEAFAAMDAEDCGELGREAWLQHAAELCREEVLVPPRAFANIFEEMRELDAEAESPGSRERAHVSRDAFLAFFGRFMVGRGDFKLVLATVGLQRVHTASSDATLRALLERKHAALLERLAHQHQQRATDSAEVGLPPRGQSRRSLGSLGSWSRVSASRMSGAGASARDPESASLALSSSGPGADEDRRQEEELALRAAMRHLWLRADLEPGATGDCERQCSMESRRHRTWGGPKLETVASPQSRASL